MTSHVEPQIRQSSPKSAIFTASRTLGSCHMIPVIMQRQHLLRVLCVLCGGAFVAIAAVLSPAAQQQLKTPVFELDPKWPSIPNNWVLGEVTSISVDSKDNIWVLHVPQSIPQ